MTDLTLHGRDVETVFDLLGEREDDITYSVGWGISKSHALARALLDEAYGRNTDIGELTAVRLQEAIAGLAAPTSRSRQSSCISSWRPNAAVAGAASAVRQPC